LYGGSILIETCATISQKAIARGWNRGVDAIQEWLYDGFFIDKRFTQPVDVFRKAIQYASNGGGVKESNGSL